MLRPCAAPCPSRYQLSCGYIFVSLAAWLLRRVLSMHWLDIGPPFLPALCVLSQVRRAVLHFLPKLPVLSTGSSDTAGQSGMQYPMAEPSLPLDPSPKHDGVIATTQQLEQPLQQAGEQALQQIDANTSNSSSGASAGSIAELLRPLGPCPICNTGDILVPFVAHPCRHVFCYYCLQSHCAADSEFACPVDGVRVDALQRYVRTVPAATA